MAPRSRTGCLTCRQRKLKCSEERPICAQCAKARRECIPSSGITFRHQQNPSMNGDPVSRESLKNFYGYKETFGRGTIWVPVPHKLTFITTNNPYEDEDGSAHPTATADDNLVHNGLSFDANQETSDGEFARQLAQAAYPQAEYSYPTHGLEALSAVASSQDQYNYAPPPAPMASHDTSSAMPHVSSPQQSHETLMQSLDSFVHGNQHTITSPPPNIDPRLGDLQPQQQQQQQQHQLHDDKPIHVRSSSYTSVRPPSLLSKGTTGGSAAIREPDVAFLIRDFSKHAGAWMDLFDLGQYFATEVPVLAVDCPLLLYSCTALSAKSLARIINNSSSANEAQPSLQKHARLAMRPGAPLDAEDWVRKGRENYDLAVSLLRQALAGAIMSNPADLPETTTAETASVTQGAPLPSTDSDELVAATAILCVYEFLDASGPEWSRHLDGAKSLFEVAKDRMVPLAREVEPTSLANQIRERLAGQATIPDEVTERGLSKGRAAIFWNFARQDMLSAFINNTNTRLDTADLPMWSSAGLNINPEGYLYPSNPSHPDYRPEYAMADDKISNALIWLQMKLVNYIAAGDEIPESLLAVRQRDLLSYWHQLESEFKAWYDGLPPSFRAIALGTDAASGLEERWFPRPMCASAMQSYHFARVQLLHNKPHISTGSPFSPQPSSSTDSRRGASGNTRKSSSSRSDITMPGSSLAARHASYASILQQSRFHAKEIVAISLGRTDEGTRIHSVQPLWTAGLVLGAVGEEVGGGTAGAAAAGGGVGAETETWRRTIVELLRGVERDLGWASEYRVRNLLDVWEEGVDE